jgi:hypothetical protein
MSRSFVKNVGVGIVLSEFLDEGGVARFKIASVVPESGADLCRFCIGKFVRALKAHF